MGTSMVRHLLSAEHPVTVFNRTAARAYPAIEAGAVWAESVKEAVAQADVVITMVGYPADVEEVYFGDDGVILNARDNALLIDMTTSSPMLAQKIASETAQLRPSARVLDAPVSGGDIGARNATLTIMVGGAQEAFDDALEIFSVMGKSVTLHGDSGSGQHCKMANQIMIAATMIGMAECLAYAQAAGLDPEKVIATLSGGSAQNWSLANYGPRVLAQDFAPGFYVKHFLKDLDIALAVAEELDLGLLGTELARQLYSELIDYSGAELGTQALCLLYMDERAQQRAGLEPV